MRPRDGISSGRPLPCQMQPEDTKPKKLSERQAGRLLMATIFVIAAIVIWLPVFVS